MLKFFCLRLFGVVILTVVTFDITLGLLVPIGFLMIVSNDIKPKSFKCLMKNFYEGRYIKIY